MSFLPPQHVIDALMKHCRCCPCCQNPPCDGVMAAGPCDGLRCVHDEDWDNERDRDIYDEESDQ